MDYFAADHSSSSSSPALSASSGSQIVFPESILQTCEPLPDSLWLDDSHLSSLWNLNLDESQGMQPSFIADYPVFEPNTSQPQTSRQPDATNGKRKTSVPTTDKATKRREQNRASQRLFRERKINYVRGIEQQLEELNEKYQDLVVSFEIQTKEKAALVDKIAKLTAKLSGT